MLIWVNRLDEVDGGTMSAGVRKQIQILYTRYHYMVLNLIQKQYTYIFDIFYLYIASNLFDKILGFVVGDDKNVLTLYVTEIKRVCNVGT